MEQQNAPLQLYTKKRPLVLVHTAIPYKFKIRSMKCEKQTLDFVGPIASLENNKQNGSLSNPETAVLI
ncbi:MULTISPECIES: hypothetical protein [Paenibacillus]|uniref:Uncharacterized protein n=1 Tax=Paenibacillus lautus TaxID=1401 RepID=A0A1R1B2R4_PAELA|nr:MULTISPECIES: hypothetical protein [Paenibacillus]MBT2760396.1 hypothetical protein [Paenibacillus sp. ISL-20]OME93085.1 hypothetical protein BK123_14625 [Paenibacillus lautus]